MSYNIVKYEGDLCKVCEVLMDECLAGNADMGGVGCDNMTVIIVGLLRFRSKIDWIEDIFNRMNNDGTWDRMNIILTSELKSDESV